MTFAKLITKQYQRDAFFAHNPTLIGIVADFKFWEHPTKGDEAPLIIENKAGQIGLSHWYELPDFAEIMDAAGFEW